MKGVIFIISLCIVTCTSAQDLFLEVDCQNPGWLSNMISYPQQQSVKNIKVTGYINATDLSFLGGLNTNQQLNGIINLEDVKIVGESHEDDNKITEGYFGGHIQHLVLPTSLVSVSNCLAGGATIDSLTIGGSALPIINGINMFYKKIISGGDGITFNKRVKHLILREGVRRIEDNAFYNSPDHYGTPREQCIFESVDFPSTLLYIGERAFCCNYALNNIHLTDSIEEILKDAFYETAYKPDTLVLPNNLKYFHTKAFNMARVYYFGDSICNINNVYSTYNNIYYEHNYLDNLSRVVIHIKSKNPPSFNLHGMTLKGLICFVPKDYVAQYENNNYWKEAFIFSVPKSAKGINIDIDSISIIKGKTAQLNVVVFPSDADNKNYTLTTSNPNIATISQDGVITAASSGDATIYATLNTNKKVIDSCFVKVYQPVTKINLDINSKEIKVNDKFKLEATIIPFDADNKNIVWVSDNDNFAVVDNGTVTALKPGNVIIYAKSEYDNNISASCKVSIQQPVTGISLNYSSYVLKNIGDLIQLNATIIPEDASNKDIDWKSSNENVCVVSNGNVVAVGCGTAVIIAISKDGNFMSTCTIKVENATKIRPLINEHSHIYKVYTLDGKLSTLGTKGIKIVRFYNGDTRKIIIK